MTNENFIVIQLVLMWFCQKDISEDKNTMGRVGSLAMPHPQDHFQKVSKKTPIYHQVPGKASWKYLRICPSPHNAGWATEPEPARGS